MINKIGINSTDINLDPSSEILAEVLKELKILNKHMQVITDEDFTEEDIEE